MASTRSKKLITQNSSPSSKANCIPSHELYEETHVLLRVLSTKKLVTIEIKLLSDVTKAKPLVSGRKISFRDVSGRGYKQGLIVLIGSYNEVLIEMNNQTNTNNVDKSPEKLQQDESLEENDNYKPESISNSSILLNTAKSTRTRLLSQLQSSITHDSAILLPSPASYVAAATTTVASNSLSSNCLTNINNRISIEDSMVNTASSIVVQRSLSLSSEPPPLTITATSRDPVTSRPLVPSTTIKRKMAGGEALKEIKHLQSLVKSKDSEINKLTEQNKKLKLELETISKHSIFIPTNDAAIQWVDYVYESIHKHEIRDQLDLDNASSDLGIERESMELCLEIGSGDRISTARQLFKYCTDYDEVIRKEHSWKYIDNDIVVKICRFIREFFGVSLKHGDEYVCESLANMVRKDSWKIRNPEKAKTKSQRSSSTNNTTSLKSSEEIDDDNYHYTNSNDDDDDVAIN